MGLVEGLGPHAGAVAAGFAHARAPRRTRSPSSELAKERRNPSAALR